jgi:hypothetical protein
MLKDPHSYNQHFRARLIGTVLAAGWLAAYLREAAHCSTRKRLGCYALSQP